MYTETRELKTALINMGYRRMGVNKDGSVMYGKPLANILLRADIDEECISILSLYEYKGVMHLMHREDVVIEEGCEDPVEAIVIGIKYAEYDAYQDRALNRAIESGTRDSTFNFITPSDLMAIESGLN